MRELYIIKFFEFEYKKNSDMKTRIYFLDNLRTFLILLVVILHSGLVYEAVLENSWIVVDPVKNNNIGLIRMYLDLFVMFSIFFISGYFVPASVKKQGTFDYIRSKFKRIILPWIISVLTLIPAYKFIFLYSRGLPQEEWYTYFHWFERAGSDLNFYANNPIQNWLWFLPVLFIFQVVYLALYKVNVFKINISLKTAVALTFLIGTVYGFSISMLGLTGWHHSPLLHFQRERLVVYFLSFLLGTLCYKLKIFESTDRNKKWYIISNVVLTVSLGVFTAFALNIFFNLIDPTRQFYFISGRMDSLVYYASGMLSMLTLLHVLIYAFRYSLNKTNAVLSELSRNSYSVYIIHVIVLGVIAVAFLHVEISAFSKFILLSILTFVISNMLIYSWRMTTIQKQINMKTISTAILSVLILVAAFSSQPVSAENNVEASESSYQTPDIHTAIIAGDTEKVKQLIASGADINAVEPGSGSTPLVTAAMFDRIEIAKMLLKAGASIDAKNYDGSTALHTAAFFCRPDMVKLLLENGADKNIRNGSGATALESVEAPFEMVKPIYDFMQQLYESIGLKIDQEQIQKLRPVVAELLKN